MYPTPQVRSSMGIGSPCCPKFVKGASHGGMARKVCGPIFFRGPPLCSNKCGVEGVCRVSQRAGARLEAGGRTAPGVQNISRGYPLFTTCENSPSPWPPLGGMEALPRPPPVTIGMRGGVKPLQILRPKFCQGFLPIFQVFKILGLLLSLM